MRWTLVCAVVVLGACGERGAPLPSVDVRIDLEAHARTVRPGRGFALDVVRTWKKDLEPSPWDDAFLSPLVVRAEGIERREDERRVQERRRFRAYVFSLDDARVAAVPFAARPPDGGELRIAASKPLRLRVEPELDAAAPGEPELPGALPRASSWGLALVALAALLGIAALVLVRRRRDVAPPPPPEAPEVGADIRALAALAALEQQGGGDADADLLEVARIVRAYVAERFALDAAARTTEELDLATGVGPVLAQIDHVKFAAHRAAGEERARVIADAAAFVRSTTP